MGMEKYEAYVRDATSTLTYKPGWSLENHTGSWRTERPVFIADRCTGCRLCWLFCPESCIEDGTWAVDLTYCKGCGICATECPVDAMVMEREGE